MPLAEGSHIGKLRLVRSLGSGAMGTAWLAEVPALGSHVVVKVLHAARAESVEARARFEQEARAVAKLDSPHVVRVFDYGVSDEGEPYIVMELLRGRDLKQVIQQEGRLTRSDVAIVVRQLCRGLRRAHALGIVHRDIKPANVFLQESDGEPFVKILDFGIAKHVGAADLGLTETGALMGTPYYMSPEQFVNPRATDLRSDLWSVAVVAYACLCGKLPFVGETVGALSVAVHRGVFTPVTELQPDLPASIDAFFARALEPHPDDRFATARELAHAFEHALMGSHEDEGETLTSAAPNAPPPAEADVDPIGATLASSVAALASEETMDATAPPSAMGPAPRSHDRRRWLVAALVAALGLLTFWVSRRDPHDAPEAADAPAPVTSDGAVREPPTIAPATHRVRVGIAPPSAEVRVDGRVRAVSDGAVVLGGVAGDSFLVEVRHGGRSTEATVVIDKNGVPSHSRVELPARAAAARPSLAASAAPAPSAAASVPKPGVTVREDWK